MNRDVRGGQCKKETSWQANFAMPQFDTMHASSRDLEKTQIDEKDNEEQEPANLLNQSGEQQETEHYCSRLYPYFSNPELIRASLYNENYDSVPKQSHD